MVIVHLSANLRRIISPEKNENLGQLFKRFCSQFGYLESEYEFRSYPDDDEVPLENNINANRIKEVSLVQKQNHKPKTKESSSSNNNELKPKIIEERKLIATTTPETLTPVNSAPQIDTPLQNRPTKRSAPKPPVLIEYSVNEVEESNIPEIEIPPPPEFMPRNEFDNMDTLFKSVECETDKDSINMSVDSSNNDSVRETPDSILRASDARNSLDYSIESLENVATNESYFRMSPEFADMAVDNKINDNENELDSDSDIEDVYEDDKLFSNFKKRDNLETKNQETEIKKDEENNESFDELKKSPHESQENDLINPVIQESEESENEIFVEINETENILETVEVPEIDIRTNLELSAPETVEKLISIHCPIAEMEDNDMSTSNSSSNENISNKFDQTCIMIDNISNKPMQNDNENCSEQETVPNKSPTPKMRKTLQKSTAIELEQKEFEHYQMRKSLDNSQIDCDQTDNSIKTTSELSNPKYFWELPKQGKTMQFLSRKLQTMDVLDTPAVKEIEVRENPPKIAPKPAKTVQVIVQEVSTEQSDRPTYRPRQAKSLYFTAGKS